MSTFQMGSGRRRAGNRPHSTISPVIQARLHRTRPLWLSWLGRRPDQSCVPAQDYPAIPPPQTGFETRPISCADFNPRRNLRSNALRPCAFFYGGCALQMSFQAALRGGVLKMGIVAVRPFNPCGRPGEQGLSAGFHIPAPGTLGGVFFQVGRHFWGT